MGTAGGEALAAALGKMADKTTLTHLSVGTNEMGAQGGLAVVKALSGFTALTQLGLNGNFFNEEGLEQMKQVGTRATLARGPASPGRPGAP